MLLPGDVLSHQVHTHNNERKEHISGNNTDLISSVGFTVKKCKNMSVVKGNKEARININAHCSQIIENWMRSKIHTSTDNCFNVEDSYRS